MATEQNDALDLGRTYRAVEDTGRRLFTGKLRAFDQTHGTLDFLASRCTWRIHLAKPDEGRGTVTLLCGPSETESDTELFDDTAFDGMPLYLVVKEIESNSLYLPPDMSR